MNPLRLPRNSTFLIDVTSYQPKNTQSTRAGGQLLRKLLSASSHPCALARGLLAGEKSNFHLPTDLESLMQVPANTEAPQASTPRRTTSIPQRASGPGNLSAHERVNGELRVPLWARTAPFVALLAFPCVGGGREPGVHFPLRTYRTEKVRLML